MSNGTPDPELIQDLKDQINALSERITKLEGHVNTQKERVGRETAEERSDLQNQITELRLSVTTCFTVSLTDSRANRSNVHPDIEFRIEDALDIPLLYIQNTHSRME